MLPHAIVITANLLCSRFGWNRALLVCSAAWLFNNRSMRRPAAHANGPTRKKSRARRVEAAAGAPGSGGLPGDDVAPGAPGSDCLPGDDVAAGAQASGGLLVGSAGAEGSGSRDPGHGCFITNKRDDETPIGAITIVIWNSKCYAAWQEVLADHGTRSKQNSIWALSDAVLQRLDGDSDFPRGLQISARVTQTKKEGTMCSFNRLLEYTFTRRVHEGRPFPLAECPFPSLLASGRLHGQLTRHSMRGCPHVVLGHPVEHLRRHPDFLKDWSYLKHAVVPEDFEHQPCYSQSPVVPQGPPLAETTAPAPTADECRLLLPKPACSIYGFNNPPASMMIGNFGWLCDRSRLYHLSRLLTPEGSLGRA